MSKKTKYLLFMSALLFILSTSLVLAEDNEATSLPPEVTAQNVSTGTTTSVPTSYDLKQLRMEQEKNRILKVEEVQKLREDNKAEMEKNKEDREILRENVKVEMEKKREEVKGLREEAKNKMEALKEKVKEVKDKTKAKIQETRILGREQALERFDNSIKKIEDMKLKVTTQITKMEAQTMIIPDTIKNLSVQADAKLTEAKAKIVEINTLLATSANELTKENKAKLTTLTKDTQTLIKEAHQLLNDEVVGLKQVLQAKIQALKELNNLGESSN